MILNHVGIINKSVEDAVRFYQEFLGLEKVKDSVVPPDLSQQLFLFPREIRMMVFAVGHGKIEIFIVPGFNQPSPNIHHFALHLKDFTDVLEKAKETGVTVITGTTREKTVYFLKDFSGNMIEIKQA
jgi:catechol 2,3-dioxygenase-like lactoylglutathione lyase family enzyme